MTATDERGTLIRNLNSPISRDYDDRGIESKIAAIMQKLDAVGEALAILLVEREIQE